MKKFVKFKVMQKKIFNFNKYNYVKALKIKFFKQVVILFCVKNIYC